MVWGFFCSFVLLSFKPCPHTPTFNMERDRITLLVQDVHLTFLRPSLYTGESSLKANVCSEKKLKDKKCAI